MTAGTAVPGRSASIRSGSDEVSDRPTVAYVVSRFPATTETFITNEIRAVESLGERVRLHALIGQDVDVHSASAEMVAACVAGNRLPPTELLAAQWHWLRRHPSRWASTWWGALWGNRRSPRFLARAIVVVPIAMCFARRIDAPRVHAHWATHPALAAWVIARLTDVPYSVTVHAHDLYVDRSMLRRKLGDAAAVVTISEYNARLLAEWFPETAGRLHVVPCGVETARLASFTGSAGAADTGPHPERAHRLVCVASLQDYKGHPHLLEACRLLRDAGVDVHLDLIGDGDRRPALEHLAASLGLADRVRFRGALSHEQVLREMAGSELMVLPSIVTASGKKEGVPVALMEALALGVPVVASDLSGVGELVAHEETGLLVPPGDAAALAAAIQRMVEDDVLRQRCVDGGRRRVGERYDLVTNARRLIEVTSGGSA